MHTSLSTLIEAPDRCFIFKSEPFLFLNPYTHTSLSQPSLSSIEAPDRSSILKSEPFLSLNPYTHTSLSLNPLLAPSKIQIEAPSKRFRSSIEDSDLNSIEDSDRSDFEAPSTTPSALARDSENQ
ncbi:unnamed protein product [Camellia sinensis]